VKPSPFLITGVFASFAAAWFGLIVAAQTQISRLQPEVDEENETVYPRNISGITEQGRQAYLSLGCNQCHTQMVRDSFHGRDIARKWGSRRTVALDYLYQGGAVLGAFRMGPDLANAGAEQEEDSPRRHLSSPQWLYQHLYNPRSLVESSNMPPYRFLFEKRKIVGQRSADALDLHGADAPGADYEVVPTEKAKALVAYLRSLDRSHPINEAAGASKAPAAAPAAAAGDAK